VTFRIISNVKRAIINPRAITNPIPQDHAINILITLVLPQIYTFTIQKENFFH